MRQTQTWAVLPSDLHVYLRPLPFRILLFGPDTHQQLELRDMRPPVPWVHNVSTNLWGQGRKTLEWNKNSEANGGVCSAQEGAESGKRGLFCPHSAISLTLQIPGHCSSCSPVPAPLPWDFVPLLGLEQQPGLHSSILSFRQVPSPLQAVACGKFQDPCSMSLPRPSKSVSQNLRLLSAERGSLPLHKDSLGSTMEIEA